MRHSIRMLGVIGVCVILGVAAQARAADDGSEDCAMCHEELAAAIEAGGVPAMLFGLFNACQTSGTPNKTLDLITSLITYAALLGRWLPDSGRRFKMDPTREVYLNDPESTDPEDLVTDIYLPLEDKS